MTRYNAAAASSATVTSTHTSVRFINRTTSQIQRRESSSQIEKPAGGPATTLRTVAAR